MLKARRQAADQIAAGLFEAEAAVSEAVRKVAILVSAVEDARVHANLSLVVGSAAGLHAINSLMALGTAKQELVLAHGEFDHARKQIGLGAVAFGDGGSGKPSDDGVTSSLVAVPVAA